MGNMIILDFNNGINSVAEGPDNGYLEGCARVKGGMRHAHNIGAVSNVIIGAQPYLRVGLYGHGSEGYLITYGQTRQSVDRYFGLDNIARWRSQVAGLKNKVNMFSLIGCKTGAGVAGYNFCKAFANATDTPVSAPTADVIYRRWSDGREEIVLDSGGTWFTAIPDRHSFVIEAPRGSTMPSGAEKRTIFVHPKDRHKVNVDSVQSVAIDYKPLGKQADLQRTLSSRQDILDFFNFVALDQMESIQGVFGQVITGTVMIAYSEGGQLNQLVLDIYGDDKLVVPNTQTDFYRLDADFVAFLAGSK